MVGYDLGLVGGIVVDEAGMYAADVYVKDARVEALVNPGATLPSDQVIDASGLHILPGLIDSHTHFRTFSKHCDAFSDMARSAAHGGITTVIAHVMGMNATDRGLLERVEHFLGEIEGTAATDYALHAGLADERGALDEIPSVIQLGVTSFKMFMAYRARGLMVTDGFMLQAMRRIHAAGGVAMIHAEAGDVADALELDLKQSAEDDLEAVAASRPPWVEAEATRRALVLAERAGCSPYFVHVSSPEAMAEILAARASGQRVYAETCPQYLNLHHGDFIRLQGKAKVAPPLRDDARRARMLEAALTGSIDVIGSDHAPYRAEDKAGDLWAAPMGAPGTETLAVMTARALGSDVGPDLTALVRLVSAQPARIFGLYPRKGAIMVGSDADFTLVDTASGSTVDGEKQHNLSGYSVYDGLSSPIRIVASFLRGQPLLTDSGLSTESGGSFLARPLPQLGA